MTSDRKSASQSCERRASVSLHYSRPNSSMLCQLWPTSPIATTDYIICMCLMTYAMCSRLYYNGLFGLVGTNYIPCHWSECVIHRIISFLIKFVIPTFVLKIHTWPWYFQNLCKYRVINRAIINWKCRIVLEKISFWTVRIVVRNTSWHTEFKQILENRSLLSLGC